MQSRGRLIKLYHWGSSGKNRRFKLAFEFYKLCLHDIGVTLIPARVHPSPHSWLCVGLPDTTRKMLYRTIVTNYDRTSHSGVNLPDYWSWARISFRYEISQEYHVNEEQRQSRGRLEPIDACVVHFIQSKMASRKPHWGMCPLYKHDTKSTCNPGIKLPLVRVFSCKQWLPPLPSPPPPDKKKSLRIVKIKMRCAFLEPMKAVVFVCLFWKKNCILTNTWRRGTVLYLRVNLDGGTYSYYWRAKAFLTLFLFCS